LIELSKIIKRNPLENYDVLFIWPGAEEWGLVGSRRFLTRHHNELKQVYDLDHSYYINIDMVGTYIGLFNKRGLLVKRKLNNHLNEIIENSAQGMDIPITKFNSLLTPKSDHRSFLKFVKKTKSSLEVAYIHSKKDVKYIHSPRDTPDKCSSENLNGCLDICYTTIRSIDSRNFYSEEIR
jgi:Zn-dependent M28 family amino/carboxypeptidase